MNVSIFKLFIFGVFVSLVNCNDGEYYWRPWAAGSPPHDAVTVRDYRGASYIVEAYIPNHGLFITQVFANQHQVSLAISNTTGTAFVVKDSHSLKVLCTQNLEKLAWYPTNYNSLKNDLVTAAINPVLGGINVQDQVAYIGKFVDTSSRIVIVGSIIRDYYVHYPSNAKPYAQGYYEILVIGSKCTSSWD